MRKINAILLIAATVLGATASASALAHGGRGHHHRHHPHARVGVFIGAPLVFAPWWYAYPAPVYYPAPAPVVVSPPTPTVYIEQGQEAASGAPRQDGYWYYCPGAKAYYPYVTQCAGGWQRVSPQPQS